MKVTPSGKESPALRADILLVLFLEYVKFFGFKLVVSWGERGGVSFLWLNLKLDGATYMREADVLLSDHVSNHSGVALEGFSVLRSPFSVRRARQEPLRSLQ